MKLIAFADDMVLISESYTEMINVVKRLEKQLGLAGLKINFDKSEILSCRNNNLPKNAAWETDDEDTDPIIQHYETYPDGDYAYKPEKRKRETKVIDLDREI